VIAPSGATLHARTATGTGEHQVIGVTAGGKLAADRLDHQRSQGHLANPGIALGPGLEATAEPAGLIPGGADLQHGQLSSEVDPAPAQPGQLTKRKPVPSRVAR
jgi:hypothetical protein